MNCSKHIEMSRLGVCIGQSQICKPSERILLCHSSEKDGVCVCVAG